MIKPEIPAEIPFLSFERKPKKQPNPTQYPENYRSFDGRTIKLIIHNINPLSALINTQFNTFDNTYKITFFDQYQAFLLKFMLFFNRAEVSKFFGELSMP